MRENRFKLSNGIRLIHYFLPATNSVTVSAMVDAASSDERPSEYGISHFIEHLLGDGSENYPDPKLTQLKLESLGIVKNAWTFKNITNYWMKSPVKNFGKALPIFFDEIFNPLFLKESIEKQKKIILEEIKMGKDTPFRVCWENLCLQVFKNSPLSHPVIGLPKTIEKFTREQPSRHPVETTSESPKRNWSRAGIEWIARLLLIASQKRTDPQEVIAEIAQPPSETLLLEARSNSVDTIFDESTPQLDQFRAMIGLPEQTQYSLIVERTQAQGNFRQKIDQLGSVTIDRALSTEQIEHSNLRYRELVGALPVVDQARLRLDRMKAGAILSTKGVKQTETILDLLIQDSLQGGHLRSIRVDSLRSLNPLSSSREVESFIQYSEQILQTIKTPQVIERCKNIGDVPKVLNRLQGLDIRINATSLLTSSGFDTPEDMEALIALEKLPDPDYQNFAEVCKKCPFLFSIIYGIKLFESLFLPRLSVQKMSIFIQSIKCSC